MSIAADPSAPAHPGPDGAVLQYLDAAESAYRAREREWEERATGLRDELAAARLELEEARRSAEREHGRVDAMHDALKEIHRTLFHGNLYEMILRSCLAITGAARGVYVTSRAGRLRVRAAVGIDGYPQADPSPFLEGLCTQVLDRNEPLVCNEGAGDGADGIPRGEGSERFANYAATPVVLMRNLDGVLVVADKAVGGFAAEDVETLLSVGDQAAVAVENRLLEKALQSAYVATVTRSTSRPSRRAAPSSSPTA